MANGRAALVFLEMQVLLHAVRLVVAAGVTGAEVPHKVIEVPNFCVLTCLPQYSTSWSSRARQHV